METDNDPVDHNLLLQFTCLGTTDKDDLVKQFRELIDKVNDSTASFYLEMNNWNLQNAIWAFLDYGTTPSLPHMSLQEAHTLSHLDPRQKEAMWWTVVNDGNEPWPQDVALQYTGGNHVCSTQSVPLTHIVYPKLGTTLVVYFVTPSEPGWYHSTWRLRTAAGAYFGDILSLVFHVHNKLEDSEEDSLSDELASRMALVDRNSVEEESNSAAMHTSMNPTPGSSEFDGKSMQDQDQEIS